MTMKQKILLSLAVLAIFFTSLLIVFGENGLNDYLRLYSHRKQLTRENEAITQENARLYRQIDRLKGDPKFIESIARRDLGMIGSEEVIVKPLNPIERMIDADSPKAVRENLPEP